jgi:hypothetical protein
MTTLCGTNPAFASSLDRQARRAIRVLDIAWGQRLIASSLGTSLACQEQPANVCLG